MTQYSFKRELVEFYNNKGIRIEFLFNFILEGAGVAYFKGKKYSYVATMEDYYSFIGAANPKFLRKDK